ARLPAGGVLGWPATALPRTNHDPPSHRAAALRARRQVLIERDEPVPPRLGVAALTPSQQSASPARHSCMGRWVGMSYDGAVITGWAAMARPEDAPNQIVKAQTNSGRALIP